MDIQTIGIVGAGQMGNGIAHVMALAGYDVLLNDVSAEALQKAVDKAISETGSKTDRGERGRKGGYGTVPASQRETRLV